MNGRIRWVWWLMPPALGLALGASTLTGRFVGRDDHTLVLDHVLVSRPSWAHAMELFRIQHRDLYQPLPLLSFSLEFALCKALDLRADLPWPEGGAWVFHLTNALLHALNAYMIARLLKRWDGRPIVAIAGACLFAVHPLTIEVVAWVNGRMMLLSTLFALAALIAADACVRRRSDDPCDGGSRQPSDSLPGGQAGSAWQAVDLSPRGGSAIGPAVGMVICALLSAVSKIRVGLPLMMLLPLMIPVRRVGYGTMTSVTNHPRHPHALPVAWIRSGGRIACGRGRVCRPFWVAWALVSALTVGFAAINVQATASRDMFEHAAGQMSGSRLARCVLALGWYLRHYVWPTGLAAWYEAPQTVSWTDPAILKSAGIVIVALLLLVVSLRHTRVGLFAAAFFLLGIGDTLPLVPARNLLAADRYMYLPMIGLVWATAVAWHALSARRRGVPCVIAGASVHRTQVCGEAQVRAPRHPADESRPRSCLLHVALYGYGVPVMVLGSLLAMSWHLAPTYKDVVAKTRRILEVHPDSPWVHERLGWAYYNTGDYDSAIKAGWEEYRRHRAESGCDALVLIGASHLAAGRPHEAVATLREALREKPDDAMAMYRLAVALTHTGDDEEAIELFRKALVELDQFNPGLTRAAAFMQAKGLTQEARGLYEQVLRNNPYDMNAAFELARMDMSEGRMDAAAARLERVLSWAPEFTAGWTNLGVCLESLGRQPEAREAYEQAIRWDPSAIEAMLNLARMEQAEGRTPAAEGMLMRALEASAWRDDVLESAAGFYIGNARSDEAANLWMRRDRSAGLRADQLARYACTLAFAGRAEEARRTAERIPDTDARGIVESAIVAAGASVGNQTPLAVEVIQALVSSKIEATQSANANAPSSIAPSVKVIQATLETCAAGFLSMLKQQPDRADLYYFYGMCEAGLGRGDIASAAFQVCIELAAGQELKDRASEALKHIQSSP